MSSRHVPGTVYQRDTGRWTALTPPQPSGRRRSLGTFATKTEAASALERFHRAARDAFEVAEMKLAAYLSSWLDLVEGQVEVGHLARRTLSGYEEAVRIHIAPELGRVRVGELNHLLVHGWLTRLRKVKGLSDQTVLRVYRTLHRALADAPLDRNPAALPKHLRPVVRKRREIMRPSSEEIGEFLVHAAGCERSGYLHPLFRLAAVSGMRRGELVGLAWPDVDLEAGTVRVERSVGMDRGDLFVKAPKSAAGERLIGVDATTVGILCAHRAGLAEDRLAAGDGYQVEPLGLDLVFRAGPDGRLVRPDLASRSFTKEWAHAGLRAGVTLHSLRHSMASLLIGEGFPVTQVAARMGDSVEVLQRVYARDLDPTGREERIVEAISGRFSG